MGDGLISLNKNNHIFSRSPGFCRGFFCAFPGFRGDLFIYSESKNKNGGNRQMNTITEIIQHTHK